MHVVGFGYWIMLAIGLATQQCNSQLLRADGPTTANFEREIRTLKEVEGERLLHLQAGFHTFH